jgi:hypothetical protein
MPEISEAEQIERDIELDERWQREVAAGRLSMEMVMQGYPVPEGWVMAEISAMVYVPGD